MVPSDVVGEAKGVAGSRDRINWIAGFSKGNAMGNRKDRPVAMRFLCAVAAFLLIGAAVYVFVAGMDLYVGAVLAASVLGLGVPAVAAGESFWEMIVGFFEAFIDGVMEVIGGIADALSSLFN